MEPADKPTHPTPPRTSSHLLYFPSSVCGELVQRPALEHTVDGLDGYNGQRRAAAVEQRTEAIMFIPLRLSSYLEQRGVHYEVCPHRH